MSIIERRKLRYQADILPLEPIGGTALVSVQNNTEIVTCNSLNADVEEDMTQVIYYVSDIHIEHQIEVIGKPLSEAREMILEKVNELVNTVDEDKGTILIAGDVADSIELTDIFYDELNQRECCKLRTDLTGVLLLFWATMNFGMQVKGDGSNLVSIRSSENIRRMYQCNCLKMSCL